MALNKLQHQYTEPFKVSALNVDSNLNVGGIVNASNFTINGKPLSVDLSGVINNSLTTTTGDLIYASSANTPARLGIGSTNQVLTVVGGVPAWAAATGGGATTTTFTLSSNTITTVETVALSTFTTIEYTLSIKQGTKIRSSKIYVQTDGSSNVDYVEYAVMSTGGTMTGISIVPALSSTNMILQATITDAASTNATIKYQKVTI